MKNKEYPEVTVKWADHFEEYEGLTLTEIKQKAKKPYIGKYRGHLIYENRRMLVLAGNVWEDHEEEDISPTMYIMKKAITYRSDK